MQDPNPHVDQSAEDSFAWLACREHWLDPDFDGSLSHRSFQARFLGKLNTTKLPYSGRNEENQDRVKTRSEGFSFFEQYGLTLDFQTDCLIEARACIGDFGREQILCPIAPVTDHGSFHRPEFC